jgi:outer membrane protein assembly factor BamB
MKIVHILMVLCGFALGVGCGTTHSGIKKTGSVLWEFSTGGSLNSSPAIGADGTVYVSGYVSEAVYALYGNNGTKKWEYITGGHVSSPPAIGADGTIYVGSYDKRVYALDGQTGAKQWEFEAKGSVDSSPAIGTDGTVYVKSEIVFNNRERTDIQPPIIYALNGKTGAKKWEWEFETGKRGYTSTSSLSIGADGTVYVGSKGEYDRKTRKYIHPPKIYALNGKTGTKQWEFVPKHSGKIYFSPAAIGIDGNIYIGLQRSKDFGRVWGLSFSGLSALNGKTGAKLWEFKLEDLDPRLSPVIGADSTIYISSYGSQSYDNWRVYALNGKTGAKIWEFEKAGKGGSAPAVGADGTVFVTSSPDHLQALDGKTGKIKWEISTGVLRDPGKTFSGPATTKNIGEKVQVKWDGSWWLGTIIAVFPGTNKVKIHYIGYGTCREML